MHIILPLPQCCKVILYYHSHIADGDPERELSVEVRAKVRFEPVTSIIVAQLLSCYAVPIHSLMAYSQTIFKNAL